MVARLPIDAWTWPDMAEAIVKPKHDAASHFFFVALLVRETV
ncbi:hypothetical protein RED65_00400 [Oceanobacter sp. RED65]|uniref:Uncharacterized protein n=1 Tax=Bermanella marisrubri TaxID=207949 RepID=Q1N5E5_9GAMM|nr:hypothetical protein RED65_00400 [Oceanobacter sp. RED65] [Bermanella marisrubri]